MWTLLLPLALAIDPGSVTSPADTPTVLEADPTEPAQGGGDAPADAIGEATDEAAPESALAPEDPAEPPWARLAPDALLDDALTRREQGDFVGAEARLRALTERGEQLPAATYQLGVLAEIQEHYPAAIACYERVLADHPDAPEATNAAFRRALTLSDLGRAREGLTQIKRLRRLRGLDDLDRASINLERGVAELRAGKQRRGIRRLQRTLDYLQGTSALTWQRARAHDALLTALLDEAATLSLDDPSRAGDAVAERRRLINQADLQRQAILALREPEYVLHSLLAIGDAATALYEAVLTAPPPASVAASPEQLAVYRDLIEDKADVFRVTGFHYYDAGAELAVRIQWQGEATAALKGRRDALAAALGRGEEPTGDAAMGDGTLQTRSGYGSRGTEEDGGDAELLVGP